MAPKLPVAALRHWLLAGVDKTTRIVGMGVGWTSRLRGRGQTFSAKFKVKFSFLPKFGGKVLWKNNELNFLCSENLGKKFQWQPNVF